MHALATACVPGSSGTLGPATGYERRRSTCRSPTGTQVRIRCFADDPSVASSLKFLRKTPWAREKVESLYLFMLREKQRAGRR